MEIIKNRRLHTRNSVKNLVCILTEEMDKKRNILNISQGGMLIENNDSEGFNIGDRKNFKIVFNKDNKSNESENFTGEIIRLQDKSIAIKFQSMNKNQERFLKQIQ